MTSVLIVENIEEVRTLAQKGVDDASAVADRASALEAANTVLDGKIGVNTQAIESVRTDLAGEVSTRTQEIWTEQLNLDGSLNGGVDYYEACKIAITKNPRNITNMIYHLIVDKIKANKIASERDNIDKK